MSGPGDISGQQEADRSLTDRALVLQRVRFWRLPWTFDASALKEDVRRLGPEHWQTHFNTGYHDGGWSGLALVSADGDAKRLYADPSTRGAGRETTLLAQCPELRAALACLPFTIESARLLKLAAGSHIREHRDHGIGLDEGSVRLHVPVFTAPGVEFYLDGVRVPMGEGECWYLDFGLPHRVQNCGAQERVHLVIDCAVNDDLRAMLPTPECSERRLLDLSQHVAPDSQQRFERFRAEVLRRPELQSELRDIEEPAVFVGCVTRLGADRALAFTEEDVRSALQAGRRAWIERHMVPSIRSAAAIAGPRLRSSAAGLRLQGWMPVLAEVEGDSLVTELCLVGARRFAEPFFEDSIAACMRRPFHSTFRHRLGDADLASWLQSNPGLAPTGFVFHMSRCGSTLLSQVLAASPGNRVLCEPGPVDTALRAGPLPADHPRRIAWLRAIVGMLGQPASAQERRFFVKFDSWHTSMLPLIRQAYPEVPWVFLVRDPVEVIVSHLRRPGAQMVPGMLGFTPPGVDIVGAAALPRDEYCARMLGAICAAALGEIERDPQLAMPVDYQDLPGVLHGPVLRHLGAPCDELEQGPAVEVMRRDAKNPSLEFLPDAESKQRAATDAVRSAAERWVMPVYRRLLALTRGPGR